MNTKYETSFQVFPHHCNPLMPRIFGGALWGLMDTAAHTTVLRLLHDSECNQAVTYKTLGVTFFAESNLGDIIFLYCEVVELRKKGVSVKVVAEKEQPGIPGRTKVAEDTLIFCTKKDGKFLAHGLSMD